MRRLVSIAGVAVALEADEPYQVQAVEALFAGCLRGREPPAVTVRYGSEPPAVPTREPDVVYPEAEVWLEEAGVAARHQSGTCGRRIGDTVVVGGPPPRAEPVRGFRQAVQHALLDALTRHDRHALHAAGLHREPVTILILGGSGAGKSTLAFAGAQHGWEVLSDDLCLVHPSDAIEVSGFPKPLNVPGDSLLSPPEGAQPIPDDDRSRWVLPHAFVTAHDVYGVSALVLVGHSPAEAGTDVVDEGPARMEVVLGSMPLRGLPAYVRAFFPIAARLSRLPAVWYLHAGEPAQRMAAATAFLDEQWERLGHGAQ
jgi:hypothetical protein